MINKKNIKSILITRTDRLGDVILTLPLITATKEVFRDSKINFFVKEYVSELLFGYKDIDEVITEESLRTFREKYRYFKHLDPDLVINVKPEFELALIFFLLRIKYRIGTGYRWFSFLYNYKVYKHRKVSDKHESDYNLNLLKNFFDEVNPGKEFFLKYSEVEKKTFAKKFSSYNTDLEDNYIIVHPGSGNSAKDLSPDKFREYVNKFLNKFNKYKIIFTGLENESPLIDNIIRSADKNSGSKIVDLSGKLNLRELMILIDYSKLFISNSTGPIHIAGAMNKSIIGFYPSEKPMSDTRWKPLSKHAVIFKPPDKFDMNMINMDEVILATSELLNTQK